MVFLGIHDDKGDYHTEMNTALFMSWFDDLLRALDRPSVIVLDNASYHNALTSETKAPNYSAKKQVLRDWLISHNVPFEAVHTKAELYEKVKKHKPVKVYETDVNAREMGHIVMRTPPRQCEFNAIELIRGVCQEYNYENC